MRTREGTPRAAVAERRMANTASGVPAARLPARGRARTPDAPVSALLAGALRHDVLRGRPWNCWRRCIRCRRWSVRPRRCSRCWSWPWPSSAPLIGSGGIRWWDLALVALPSPEAPVRQLAGHPVAGWTGPRCASRPGCSAGTPPAADRPHPGGRPGTPVPRPDARPGRVAWSGRPVRLTPTAGSAYLTEQAA